MHACMPACLHACLPACLRDPPRGFVQVISGETGEVSTLVAAHEEGAPGPLLHPVGIAVDGKRGAVLVGDTGHHCLRAIDRTSGTVTTLAGTPDETGFRDGPGPEARFSSP
jgi:hypothetical protein